MRRITVLTTAVLCAAVLSACERGSSKEEIEEALKDVNVIDETNLNDVMLTVADPDEAVAYFARTSAANPDRIELKRGLAVSLVRAGKPTMAATAWSEVLQMEGANHDDRVEYADALIRSNRWADAEAELDKIPPTHETFKRYRLEAMVADSNKEWNKADSFYEIAVSLTTRPSGTLNNWGYSKLTRGDYAGAEQLFGEALTYDSGLFTAKNNLVLARAAQRKYDMPVVPMTQIERAQLIHTAALSAIKQGDVNTGKSLLQEAIDTHPQYFDAAVRSLEALEAERLN
ncbi:tetratricopeptide repeat protein [Alphaproteobacteria bacterium GH1-50]|uniref:Tetratricopeptide repeat protein n=1 Tax=Kangsaoukella pontilimi TaxID=2691042 RepID=A0A7C9MBI8_9RHOB|nr:tetratricopeptide repeat protein [Kangsaoukella pontilimi]MXQ08733.1 tetratricopeptide repeat protein [Kangsaoukella pontilimi]